MNKVIEHLNDLKSKGIKKKDTLDIAVKADDNFQELIDFFKMNEFEVKKITLNFSEIACLITRSSLLIKFNKVLEHIKGLKVFELNATVKDYALKAVLCNPSLLKIEELALIHNRVERSKDMVNSKDFMVNSKDFFETTLVSFLAQNQDLVTLRINDNHEDIRAAKYPKLKSALSAHPKLNKFVQVMVSYLSTSILQKDPELISAFQNKTIEPEAVKKERLEASYNEIIRRIGSLNTILNSICVVVDKTVERYLTRLLTYLKKLNKAYTSATDDNTAPRKTAQLNVLINYVILLRQALILKEKMATLNTDDKNSIEEFWDCTRIELHKNIHDVKENESYEPILEEINAQNQKLKIIKSHVPASFFPASYKNVAQNKDKTGELEQALSLLDDYTKGNSTLRRVFYGHWNRHYISEVNTIILNKSSFQNVDELLLELYKINIKNPNGSLARRIQYIEDNFQLSDETLKASMSV